MFRLTFIFRIEDYLELQLCALICDSECNINPICYSLHDYSYNNGLYRIFVFKKCAIVRSKEYNKSVKGKGSYMYVRNLLVLTLMSCSVRLNEAMSDSRRNDEKPISRLQYDLSDSPGIRRESPKKTLNENLSTSSHKYRIYSELYTKLYSC